MFEPDTTKQLKDNGLRFDTQFFFTIEQSKEGIMKLKDMFTNLPAGLNTYLLFGSLKQVHDTYLWPKAKF